MKRWIVVCALLLAAGLFFGSTIDPVSPAHTDSIVFATIARNMVESGNWLIPAFNGQPDFWKPPLQYWLIGLSYKIFGVSPVSAVLPCLLFGMAGVWAVYHLGRLFWNEKAGIISALVLATNFHYYEAARMAMMDLGVSVLILLALVCWARSHFLKDERWLVALGFYFFTALAVLMKGPQGAAIPVAIVGCFALWTREMPQIWKGRALLTGALVFLAVALPWYLIMILRFGETYARHFFFQENIHRVFGSQRGLWERLVRFPSSFFEAFAAFGFWNFFLLPAWALGVRELLRGRRGDRAVGFLTIWVSALFIGFSLAWASAARYFQPLLPGAAVLAGGYLFKIASPGARPSRGLGVSLVLTVALVLASFAAALWIWARIGGDGVPVWGAGILVLVFASTLAWILLRRRWEWVPFQLGLFMIVTLLLGFGWAADRISLKPNRYLSRVLSEMRPSNFSLGVTSADAEKELVYFARLHPRVVRGLSETLDFLARNPKACLIATRREYEGLPEEARARLEIKAVALGWPTVRMRMFSEPDPFNAAFQKVEWLLLIQDRSLSS